MHRLQEGTGALRQALALAEEHDLPTVGLRARYNLVCVSLRTCRLADAVDSVAEGLRLARELGDRSWERAMLQLSIAPLVVLGRWDEATFAAPALIAGEPDLDAAIAAAFLTQIAWGRDDDATLERCQSVAGAASALGLADVVTVAPLVQARAAFEHGSPDVALQLARPLFGGLQIAELASEEAYSVCTEAALTLGDENAMNELIELVDAMPPVRANPLMRAGRERLAAECAHRNGASDISIRHQDEAIALLRSIGARPLLAAALLERARRHDDADALAEARVIYTELGATRWLAKLDNVDRVTA
jgi:hypothetical protein